MVTPAQAPSGFNVSRLVDLLYTRLLKHPGGDFRGAALMADRMRRGPFIWEIDGLLLTALWGRTSL
jgi:hypothetical protein